MMKNDKDNIQEMLKEASNIELDYEDEDEKSNRKGIIIFAIFTTLLIGVLLLGKQVLSPQEFVDKTEAPDLNDGGNSILTSDDTSEIVWGFKKPVEIPDWANTPFNKDSLNNEEFRSKVQNYSEGYQGVTTAFGYKLSTVDGYTSNPVEEEIMSKDLEITIPNELYTEATKEDYYEAFSIYTQLLINPVFGDWVFANEPESIHLGNPFNKFSEIFSNEWWEENIVKEGNYRNLPIIYDWDNDRFEGEIEEEFNTSDYNIRSSFYGEMYEDYSVDGKFIESDISYKDGSSSEVISVSVPITYKAFNLNGKLERNAIMTIEFEVNEDKLKENNRILISDVNIEYIDIET